MKKLSVLKLNSLDSFFWKSKLGFHQEFELDYYNNASLERASQYADVIILDFYFSRTSIGEELVISMDVIDQLALVDRDIDLFVISPSYSGGSILTLIEGEMRIRFHNLSRSILGQMRINLLSNYPSKKSDMKLKKHKIFILEDNFFYANLLMMRIENLGFEDIQLFGSSEEFLRELHQQPFLAILDYNLPDSKGLAVLKAIKRIYPYTHCVMISGLPKIGVADDCLQHGALDYLLKGEDDNTVKLEKLIEDCHLISENVNSSNSSSLDSPFKNKFL